MQLAHLLNCGVDGVLLAPDTSTAGTPDMLAWLREANVPVVLIEREAFLSLGHTPFESVNTDHLTEAGTTVRFPTEQGHQPIGFVTSPRSPHAAQIRRAWDASLAARFSPPLTPFVHTG